MANAFYDPGRNAFAKGDVSWKAAGGSTIRAYLIDSADYTVDLVNHDFLDDVAGAARVANGTLTLIDPVAGVLDANDRVFAAVTGDQSEALIIVKDTGVEATSNLLMFINSATGLPVTPNSGDITVTWDNGANKIAKL